MSHVFLAPTLLAIASVLVSSAAASEPVVDLPTKPTARKLAELEARAKALPPGEGAAKRFDAFMGWLGLTATCSVDDCKTIDSARWVAANLDADPDEERVLAITTVGADAKCPSANLEVVVFDPTGDGLLPIAHARMHLGGGVAPTLEVVAAAVHSAKQKDLILHVDGQCKGADREQQLRVLTLENGKLEELAESASAHGTGLLSYALVGAAPAKLELTDGKGKTRLFFDEAAFVYDALPPYEETLKTTVSKDTDDVLSTKECAAPLGGAVAGECGLKGSAKVQVLVQNGKPIALTVTVTPESRKFHRCMRKHIAASTWASTPGASGCTRTFAVK